MSFDMGNEWDGKRETGNGKKLRAINNDLLARTVVRSLF